MSKVSDAGESAAAPLSDAGRSTLESAMLESDRLATGRSPFVGRAPELTVLRAALADARDGRGRFVLLAGEPGIGKTRTAEELAADARASGVQVLWGRCYEGEGAPPFWPWVQLLRSAAKRLRDDDLQAALGWGGAELVHLVPELRHRLPQLTPTAALDSPQDRFRLFDTVARFLENLSRHAPLVCVIDDLHGGDRPSLRLLEFVARELREASALLLGTYRHGATLVGHPLTELVVDALRLPGVERLTLSGLSLAEVSNLVERMTGVPPAQSVVAALHRQTEGNPLFVGEYVRLLLAQPGRGFDSEALRVLPVPDSVRAVVRHRVAPLSSTCRTALSVAAVIGREFQRDAVETLLAGDADAAAETRVFGALDEAVAAGIIGEELERSGRYRFAHAVMREALYEEIGSGRRLQLHRRVGEILEQRSDAEEHLAELAYHFYQAAAGSPPIRAGTECAKAVAYAQRAADRAMTGFAYEEAVRLYQLAVAARDHCSVEDDPERRTLLGNLDIARAASERVLTESQRRATAGTESAAPAQTVAPSDAVGLQGRSAALDAIFRQEGDYWTLAYGDRTLRLKDSKGLKYLAHLLRHPGQDFLAIDLAIQAAGAGNEALAIRGQLPERMLDAQAKADYRGRLQELRKQLAEAEAHNDLGRIEHARAEIDFIGRELTAAVGLGGSDRQTGSAAERARSTVTKGIKSAIAKIRAAHPSAGRYLARTIRTGYFCAYRPDPDDDTKWIA